MPKTKRPPLVLNCDEYHESQDGTDYFPHVGEYVSIRAGATAEDLKTLHRIEAISAQIDAMKGDAGEATAVSKLIDEIFDDAVASITKHVVDWNWTDDHDKPYPTPDGSEGPIRKLKASEIMWLVTSIAGSSKDERKNG